METLLEYGVVVLAIGAVPASVIWSRHLTQRRRAAEWRVVIRAAHQGGTVVELVRPGEPAQRITRLDPTDEEFSTKLEDARAAALERAVALNVARQGLTP